MSAIYWPILLFSLMSCINSKNYYSIIGIANEDRVYSLNVSPYYYLKWQEFKKDNYYSLKTNQEKNIIKKNFSKTIILGDSNTEIFTKNTIGLYKNYTSYLSTHSDSFISFGNGGYNPKMLYDFILIHKLHLDSNANFIIQLSANDLENVKDVSSHSKISVCQNETISLDQYKNLKRKLLSYLCRNDSEFLQLEYIKKIRSLLKNKVLFVLIEGYGDLYEFQSDKLRKFLTDGDYSFISKKFGPEFYYDGLHLTRQGHCYLAKTIQDKLEIEGSINCNNSGVNQLSL